MALSALYLALSAEKHINHKMMLLIEMDHDIRHVFYILYINQNMAFNERYL